MTATPSPLSSAFLRSLACALVVMALAPSVANAQRANSYTVAVRAEDGLYLSGVGSQNVEIDSSTVGADQTFTVIHTAEGKLKFRAPNGRWLVALGDGAPAERVIANPLTHGGASSFITYPAGVPIHESRALGLPGQAWTNVNGSLRTQLIESFDLPQFTLEPLGFNVRFLDSDGHTDEGGGQWRYRGDLIAYVGDQRTVTMTDARVTYRRDDWGLFGMFRGRGTVSELGLGGLVEDTQALAGTEVTFRLRNVMSSDQLPVDRDVDMLRLSVAEPTEVGPLSVGAGSTWIIDHRDGGLWIRGDIDVAGDAADRYVSTGGAFGDDLLVSEPLDLVLGGQVVSMAGPTVLDVAPGAFADGELALRELSSDGVDLVAHGHTLSTQGETVLDFHGIVRAEGDMAFELLADSLLVDAADGASYELSDVVGSVADAVFLDGEVAPEPVTIEQRDRGYGDTLDIYFEGETTLMLEGSDTLAAIYQSDRAYLGTGELASRCPINQNAELTIDAYGPTLRGELECETGFDGFQPNNGSVSFRPRSSDATVSSWHMAYVASDWNAQGYDDRVDSTVRWTGNDIEFVNSQLDQEGISVHIVVDDFDTDPKMGFWDQGTWRQIK